MPPRPRVLITAGPTHEPIDAVRYLANRSSGRLGVALADAAAARGWSVTLLLGPTHLAPAHPSVDLQRFRTAADLAVALEARLPACDLLIMAAAVADFRPVDPTPGKHRRDASLVLQLEPTPDLLAACAARAREDQTIVGFALEPSDRLEASAREKLARKGLDLIVANPLETMDSPEIRATLYAPGDAPPVPTPGPMQKNQFAPWLLDHLEPLLTPR